MKYSKGIMWLDDCRIPYQNGIENEFSESYLKSGHNKSQGNDLILNISGNKRDGVYVNQQGRFTPNLLVCDDMLNDGVITQYNKTREDKGNYLGGHRKEYVGTTDNDIVKQIKGQFFSDKGSNSRYYDLDKWFDKVIDEIQ
jgi:hypothetical protein